MNIFGGKGLIRRRGKERLVKIAKAKQQEGTIFYDGDGYDFDLDADGNGSWPQIVRMEYLSGNFTIVRVTAKEPVYER